MLLQAALEIPRSVFNVVNFHRGPTIVRFKARTDVKERRCKRVRRVTPGHKTTYHRSLGTYESRYALRAFYAFFGIPSPVPELILDG